MDDLDYKSMRPVAVWLYICAGAVFLMAIIGAVTRLTESGLSIVEWRPVTGALPPLNDTEWQRVFDLYKETSEYRLANSWMELDDFKHIFFWEWFHRLWGRMIGIIYALPFFYFLIRGKIPRVYLPAFWVFLGLGAAQAVMGWYMVQSGFVDRTDVSHYRLAAHLGLAFIIFGLLLNMAFKLSRTTRKEVSDIVSLRPYINAVIGLVFVTMIYGAMVAGLNAGLIYNSFPMMGDYPWPNEAFDMTPLWINLFENHATVQFIHRFLAIGSALAVLLLCIRGWRCNLTPRLRGVFTALALMVVVQVSLGIATLLSQVSLPLAVMHQGGAMVLLGVLIWARSEALPADYSADRKEQNV